MRYLQILSATLAIGACTATSMAVARPSALPTLPVSTSCAARHEVPNIQWHISDETDSRELSRWCRAVGAPVFVAQPAGRPPLT